MHANMAVVRGIEGGYSVVRAAQRGLVSISDPYGRTVARPTGAQTTIVVSTIEAEPRSTIYTSTGDIVGFASLLLAAFCCAMLWFDRRKSRVDAHRRRSGAPNRT